MKMFDDKSFDVFNIEGLEARMVGIREVIQPIFNELDTYFVDELSSEVGEVLPIHIAQHRRRTANAPDFTWSAMGGDKRGYKKYPHFQLGITPEYALMWLSFIDNPEFEVDMAELMLENLAWFTQLPSEMMINTDHTKNNYHSLEKEQLVKDLTRFKTVKKGEFQIGRVLTREKLVKLSQDEAREYMLETYKSLVPIYLACMSLRQANTSKS
ncbi:DUF1054 family protein [Vagococcus jeotgali]|uniref:DUF1054 family protein n=1 Tax=Vagococcus jeotgali TaxID=3109030 RepID=UPI002DD84074|nr:DUF1054 family protein [Vagococcus sp. B2T-5]